MYLFVVHDPHMHVKMGVLTDSCIVHMKRSRSVNGVVCDKRDSICILKTRGIGNWRANHRQRMYLSFQTLTTVQCKEKGHLHLSDCKRLLH